MNFGEENIENVPPYKFVFAYFPHLLKKTSAADRAH